MKTGFFEERPGVKSSTRLNSFILLFFFIAFNLLWIQDNDITGNYLLLDTLLLVAVFIPKYLHKLAEVAIKARTGQDIEPKKPE